ncbi:MAG: DUF951 domain-containing protein [Chloroflexaceae bacterium]|nr:DUF951 domain-containing protein [Chloroflexaceae bacterium]
MAEPVTFELGDVVQLRKAHPCGGDTWQVVRLGAEIGLRCETCERRVLLPRAELERRMRRFVQRGTDLPGAPPGAEAPG